MEIYDLPVEIWRHICSDLSVQEKVHMVVADKFFRGAVDTPEIDRVKDQLFCRGCKMAPINGLYEDRRCVDCYDSDTSITASRAMNVFGLTPEELGKLPHEKPSCYSKPVLDRRAIFKFKDVRDAARKKHGKRMVDVYRDLEDEQQRRQAAENAEEAARTETLRRGLAQLGVEYSKKYAHLARVYLVTGCDYEEALERVQTHVLAERECAARAAIINERLDALGIDRQYYSELREKYAKNWAGYRNLDRLVQIIADTRELERELSGASPRQKLERALGLRGVGLRTSGTLLDNQVELHTDSRLCQGYLAGESRLALTSIVERKFEMHLLHRHTNYDECCKDASEILAEFTYNFHENMTYFCEDLANHCLAALGSQDEDSARGGPLCRCGLSSEIVHSQAALDYVDDLDDCGPPMWMQD